MVKIKRGNFVFLTRLSDHEPRHVHVYKDGRTVLKWDLTNHRLLKGVYWSTVVEIIEALIDEGKL